MCLSIPARILSVHGDAGELEYHGNRFMAGLQLITDPAPGDYVLVHAGFAIQKISEEEALATLRLIGEMDNALKHPDDSDART
ncbi:MAG TPA: HypC/HybG/HupF family hydrogenase formation chaperone [Bacteroidales bacterium]|nr:HypC/HybG/HupF family hydrogenase formation chaperone [Bacteroidales bacterium]